MRFFKVCCRSCSFYERCSRKTKLFVNYCGSRLKNYEQEIQNAIIDCRAQQGLLLKSSSSFQISERTSEAIAA